jgi:simple sugar transport system permease protein
MNLMIELIRSTFLAAVPILLASLGGTYTYYADIFNIAMEGMLLIGAFAAVLGSYFSGSWFIGLLAGISGGILAALIFTLFAVYLKTDEFVTGIALNLFALGATTYLLRQIFSVKGAFASSEIVALPNWHIPIIDKIPILGELLSGYPFLLYITFLIAILVEFHIFKTSFGLRLRATGEDDSTVDSVGINSNLIKSKAILLSGLLSGLGGVFLSLAYVNMFAENMSNGRGWIALAVIILTRGRPIGLLFMALLFGFFDGLGFALQNTFIPSQFTQMVPYLATLVALYFYSKKKKVESKEDLEDESMAV